MVISQEPQVFFEVIQHHQGGFSANCLNAEIQTRGGSLAELHDNITFALERHFRGTAPSARSVHLLFFRE